jgi:hypothetical protein
MFEYLKTLFSNIKNKVVGETEPSTTNLPQPPVPTYTEPSVSGGKRKRTKTKKYRGGGFAQTAQPQTYVGGKRNRKSARRK